MTTDERAARGKALLAKLTAGTPLVADSAANYPSKLMENTVNFLFGELWSGPELTLEERSLATCSALIAMNRIHETKAHFAAARNIGIPREKLEGIITHLAAYAGWPCAVTAAHSLNEVWPKE